MTADINDLVKLCVQGDNHARRSFYDIFSENIMGACKRYLPHADDANDVFQEAFIHIFQQLHKWDHTKGNIEGWLYRVATNVALKALSKKKRDGWDEIAVHNEPVDISSVVDELALEDLVDMIQQLPDGQRTVFNMYLIEGYSHQEISVKLNISESGSKSQLSRAKETIRNLYTQYHSIES